MKRDEAKKINDRLPKHAMFHLGIAAFSVHGWIWFVFAFLGSLIGVKLRPYCAYKN
ncbi:hypothetical protein [Bacillus alveayuensis]|uniref:hypothetical protein n=1 Tax=Aeribacillus alveayuensis TaxID=279215 RepID=UPI000AB100B6|nr:hypothetical protein [Bacillus alveayuensis]